jgi:hypothetical protein
MGDKITESAADAEPDDAFEATSCRLTTHPTISYSRQFNSIMIYHDVLQYSTEKMHHAMSNDGEGD